MQHSEMILDNPFLMMIMLQLATDSIEISPMSK